MKTKKEIIAAHTLINISVIAAPEHTENERLACAMSGIFCWIQNCNCKKAKQFESFLEDMAKMAMEIKDVQKHKRRF